MLKSYLSGELFFVYWIRVWDLLVIVGSITKRGMAKDMEVHYHHHHYHHRYRL